MIEFWNLHKVLWSLVLFLTFGMVQPYAQVPVYESPAVAASYLMTNFVYTGDGVLGTVDIIVRPETLQGAMEQGPDAVKRLNLDCDDVGAWAFVAIRKMGGTPTLYTLKDSSGRFGHHVVTAYTWKSERGVIDTNGHRLMAVITPAALCDEFTRVYVSRGYRYTEAVVTVCPF